mgnify:CR=1 FL=1
MDAASDAANAGGATTPPTADMHAERGGVADAVPGVEPQHALELVEEAVALCAEVGRPVATAAAMMSLTTAQSVATPMVG